MFRLALTAFAAAALVGSAVATPIRARDFTGPPGLSQFQLTTIPNGDNDTYSGWWPVAFHTGASENAAVLSPNRSDTLTWRTYLPLYLHIRTHGIRCAPAGFNSTSGDVYWLTPTGPNGEEIPWSLGLADAAPYESDAPAGYKLVTVNAGWSNAGFSFDGDVLPNPAGYGTLAACYVNGTAPYWSLGPQVQLLWRPEDVPVGACADVLLKAVSVE